MQASNANRVASTLESRDPVSSAQSRRIAIVTGGSRGLGRNAALKLASSDVDIILTYRSRQAEARSAIAQIEEAGGRAVSLQLDVGDSSSLAAFARRVEEVLSSTWQRNRFDILLNNAGIGINVPFTQTTEAQFNQLMAIQLKGPFFLTQALLPLIEDGGRILNVSTGLTRFSLPGHAAYASMKGGVEVLTRYLAKELGPRNIAVNVIAPGAVETDFDGGSVRDNASVNAFVAANTALGRAGRPDDIGDAIVALLAKDNRWMNAQRVEVSGGMFV